MMSSVKDLQKYTFYLQHVYTWKQALSLNHCGPTVGRLKRLGRLGRVWEQICSVCSAALEAFGTAWTRLLRFNLWSRRTLAAGRLSHWILWLRASCMTILIGGVLVISAVCGRARCCGVGSRRGGMLSATFLPTGDERQRSGGIKAAGRWCESGWCVQAFTLQTLFSWVKLQRQVKSKEEEITWFNHFTSSSIDQIRRFLFLYICKHSCTLESWCCDVMLS